MKIFKIFCSQADQPQIYQYKKRNLSVAQNQSDQMARLFSTFGHKHERKFTQWHGKFAKVVTKFCQIINSPPKNFLKILTKWRDFVKSGHTAQNSMQPSTILPFKFYLSATEGEEDIFQWANIGIFFVLSTFQKQNMWSAPDCM